MELKPVYLIGSDNKKIAGRDLRNLYVSVPRVPETL